MMQAESNTHEELILEVLKVAALRISVKDFQIQCELAPSKPGSSYYDRLRVAEQLIEDGIIEKVDKRLRVVAKDVPDWLRTGMQNGSKISWRIFDAIDVGGKIRGRIDHELLASIGLDGEKAVIKELRQGLSVADGMRIRHISLVDDSAGYDICSPSVVDTSRTRLLEVKTSSRPGADFSFFISRNEVRVASQNENWYMVAVLREPSGYRLLGYVTYLQFADVVPVNVSPFSHWESASVRIPVNQILPGLP